MKRCEHCLQDKSESSYFLLKGEVYPTCKQCLFIVPIKYRKYKSLVSNIDPEVAHERFLKHKEYMVRRMNDRLIASNKKKRKKK